MDRRLTNSEIRAQAREALDAGTVAERTEPRATSARYDRRTGRVEVTLANGCVFAFPARDAEGLSGATPDALSRVQVGGGGYALRWDALDVDLTVPGLMEGFLGSARWMAKSLGRSGGRVRSLAKARAARKNGQKGGRPPQGRVLE